MNIYGNIVRQNLPRLLALYDLDECSRTFGYGDRIFWGWKTIDFANGSMQGGVYSLAAAHKLGLLPNRDFTFKVIDAAMRAITSISGATGTLEEAYPDERSFCVTALVAHNVLSAILLLEGELKRSDRQDYLNIVRPLIVHICEHDETHAIISNHLATAAAAVALWNHLTGERHSRGRELLDTILQHQSEEGWYREYEGADPGYQTLCTYYLASYYQVERDDRLRESLAQSAAFLKYFVHPDGTIGGLYGSRNTEVYYPAGLEILSPVSRECAAMARKLKTGIEAGRQVTPDMIDSGNFIPLLNAYAAAALAGSTLDTATGSVSTPLPCEENNLMMDFKEAGIFVRANASYFAIVNYHKGGTLKVFDRATGLLDCEDGGVAGRLASGDIYSTQMMQPELSFANATMNCGFFLHNNRLPAPADFALLRLLGLTVLRVGWIGDYFKKMVVRMLMTGKRRLGGGVVRRFEFGPERIIVTEEITEPSGTVSVSRGGKFSAIHMASSGYYLRQVSEAPSAPVRVEFR